MFGEYTALIIARNNQHSLKIFLMFSFNKFKLLFVLAVIVFIIVIIYNYKYYVYNYKYALPKCDTIRLHLNGHTPKLIDVVNSNILNNQSIITSYPRIFMGSIKHYIPNKFCNIDISKIGLDLGMFVDNLNLGGFILYDGNKIQIHKYKSLKNFILELNQKTTINIIFIDLDVNKKYRIIIKPFIFADCDLLENGYCRFKEELEIKNTSEDKIFKYKIVGINSPLSPTLDLNSFNISDSLKLINLSKLLNTFNIIPCIKHFGYDYNSGDTHLSASYNCKNLVTLLKEDLYPYSLFDSISIKPYLLMVGHHYLNSIDSQKIASRSEKVQLFIENNYCKAVTISDDIGMNAFKKGNASKNTETDLIMSSINVLLLNHNEIIDSRNKENTNDVIKYKNKLLRILNLKFNYGLLEIEQM